MPTKIGRIQSAVGFITEVRPVMYVDRSAMDNIRRCSSECSNRFWGAEYYFAPLPERHVTKQGSHMKCYRIPQTDLEVSRIAFGCDLLVQEGVSPDALSADDIAKAARLVNVAHDNGITLFDTAEGYGRGSSEAALGRVLAQSPGLRNKVAVQTKCAGLGGRGGMSHSVITSRVEESLKRLSTDHVDILLLHIQDPLMEPEEVARAFDDLKRSGKVRHFGVSNHTITRIELLKKYVRQPLVIHQIQLSLAHPALLDELTFARGSHFLGVPYTGIAGLDYCRLHDLQVQAYSPLRGKSVFGKAELLGPPEDVPAELKETAKKLHELAADKGASPAAVALAWLLKHPGRILPIIGAKRTEHILDCCSADKVELNPDEWLTLWSTLWPS
jgi:predicted oxidoreductase